MTLVQSFMDGISHTNYDTMMVELMQTLEPFFNLLNSEIHKELSTSHTHDLLVSHFIFCIVRGSVTNQRTGVDIAMFILIEY
jgi:hypothetical protein